MVSRTLALVTLLVVLSAPAKADIFSDISNALNSATNTVSNGINTAANAVSNGVNTAVNTVGNGLNVAANATEKGLDTALNKTGQFINTATDSVKDAYQTSRTAVDSVTNSVESALAPAANRVEETFDSLGDSIYRVSTNTYNGLVQYGTPGSPASQTQAAQNTSVDATNATSILNALTSNSTGFITVANSVLVALGQDKASGVQSGIRNLINNRTGNTSYPTTGLNDTVSVSLAEALVTALVTAQNYTVTVDFNGSSRQVNSTQVVNVFLAGFQDAVTPCARNASSGSTANTTGTYFSTIAQKCCYLVSQPLRYSASLAQSNTVGGTFSDGLSRSQTLGQSPSLDLTRCLDQSATA